MLESHLALVFQAVGHTVSWGFTLEEEVMLLL